VTFQNIPSRPIVIYDLVLHWPTGERYALKKEPEGDGWQVTGYVGPRPLDEWRRTSLEELAWETDRLEWIRAEREAGHFDLTG
jgi:hypothetical protein